MNIIIRPIVTEKNTKLGSGKYAFEVERRATKKQIKAAIETYFGVKVAKVRTIVSKGEIKRSSKLRRNIKTAETKKALIRLKTGKIELLETKT